MRYFQLKKREISNGPVSVSQNRPMHGQPSSVSGINKKNTVEKKILFMKSMISEALTFRNAPLIYKSYKYSLPSSH